MTTTLNKFVVDDTELELSIQSGVFVPTATTSSLINAVKSYIKKPGKLLDLGAGSGVVGISLALEGIAEMPLYASDLSESTTACITKNCARYNISVEVKAGSLLDPWRAEKFDYIVDDISGVDEETAKLSPWFDDVPCQSGVGGADLTIQVLQDASKHLNENGMLFFPIISFSDVDKILDVARKSFTNVELLKRDEWPLPKDMYEHLSTLKRIKEEGNIHFEEKFGMILCFTDIYVAFNR